MTKRARKGTSSAVSRPRRRLPADEARRRIIEAAEQQLMKVGPQGLRLTDLARTLQVSHPALLHHFGTREGLVAAVVQHVSDQLNEQLLAAFAPGTCGADHDKLLDMVAEVYGERGFARLSAWLILSGRAANEQRPREPPLKRLAEAAHALRLLRRPSARFEDTLFELQLGAIALLGDAIFGDAVRRASGIAESPEGSRDFRRWLAALLRARS